MNEASVKKLNSSLVILKIQKKKSKYHHNKFFLDTNTKVNLQSDTYIV